MGFVINSVVKVSNIMLILFKMTLKYDEQVFPIRKNNDIKNCLMRNSIIMLKYILTLKFILKKTIEI